MQGREIEGYKLGPKISAGAYGAVHAGIGISTGLKVAVKCVNKDFILQHDKKRHVFREKKILESFDHPNIIKLIKTS